MSSKTILAILLVASLAGNASFLFTAFNKRPARPAGTIDRLQLTAKQTTEFESSRQAFQKERARVQENLAQLRAVLADELIKDLPDRQRLMTTALSMAQLQTDMRPKLIEHLLALHALLSPGQRATLAQLVRAAGGVGAACPGARLYSSPEEEG